MISTTLLRHARTSLSPCSGGEETASPARRRKKQMGSALQRKSHAVGEGQQLTPSLFRRCTPFRVAAPHPNRLPLAKTREGEGALAPQPLVAWRSFHG